MACKPDALFAMAMPMGLFSMAADLVRAGHQVEMVHAGVERQLDPGFELARLLAARPPDLVGLSLHWHHQLAEVLHEAQAIGEALPAATIVAGGMTASHFAGELLGRCAALDAVVRGEGERPLTELVRRLERAHGSPRPGPAADLGDVPNLSWRDGEQVVHNPLGWHADGAALSAMDFTRLDLLRHAELYSGDPWVPLDAPPPEPDGQRTFYLCVGRGCDWECAFCAGCRTAHQLFTGRSKPAIRSVESVVESFRRLDEQAVTAPFICFEPAAATHTGYYLELFAALRQAGMRPGLELECFSLPSDDFIDAFAATFDLARSQLVLSPGTANEAVRGRIHGPTHSNADLEAVLGQCRARGVRTHVCFSIYPSEGWRDARALARWQRRLAERYRCSLFQCPIEMEPAAPWERQPERWGLGAVRSDVDAYLERHRREGQHERAWDEEVGFATEELGARALLLRSATEDAVRWVRRAATGLWRQRWWRLVSGPVGALGSMLEAVGRMQPGQVAVVLSAQLDDDGVEALARRIAAESPAVVRLYLAAARCGEVDRAWPPVAHAAGRYRSIPASASRRAAPSSAGGARPAGGIDGSAVTELRLRNRKDAALLVRDLLAGGAALAEAHGRAGAVLADACRFAPRPCPAVAGRRLCFDELGRPAGCTALRIDAPPGSGWQQLTGRMRALASEIERRRGCARCPVRDRCARCPAPAPLSEEEYCALMRTSLEPGRYVGRALEQTR